MATACDHSPSPRRAVSGGETAGQDLREIPASLPTTSDLQEMAATIQQTQRKDMAEITESLRGLRTQMEKMDKQISANRHAIRESIQSTNEHHKQLFLIRYQVEYHDNRGRRNNLRIRGLTESVKPEDLEVVVRDIFNSFLERSPDSVIELDRVHRSIGSNARMEQPHDVICRLNNYKIK